MTNNHLFHFSDNPAIKRFVPRATIRKRPPGSEWLNDPLVWAICKRFAFLYLFPRQCPRILFWPVQGSTATDIARWIGPGRNERVALVERCWWERLLTHCIHRYDLPGDGFVATGDVGMHVNRAAVVPDGVTPLTNLPDQLAIAGVDLRFVDRLGTYRQLWDSTLHASGIRLGQAQGWDAGPD